MIFPFLNEDHFEWFYNNKCYENINTWVSGTEGKYTIITIDEIASLTNCKELFDRFNNYNPIWVSIEFSYAVWECLHYYQKIPNVSLALLGKNSKFVFIGRKGSNSNQSPTFCSHINLELFKEDDVFEILKKLKRGNTDGDEKLREESKDIIEKTGGVPRAVFFHILKKNTPDEVKMQNWDKDYNLIYHYFNHENIHKNVYNSVYSLKVISNLLNTEKHTYDEYGKKHASKNVNKLDLFQFLGIPYEFHGNDEVHLRVPKSYLASKYPSGEEMRLLDFLYSEDTSGKFMELVTLYRLKDFSDIDISTFPIFKKIPVLKSVTSLTGDMKEVKLKDIKQKWNDNDMELFYNSISPNQLTLVKFGDKSNSADEILVVNSSEGKEEYTLLISIQDKQFLEENTSSLSPKIVLDELEKMALPLCHHQFSGKNVKILAIVLCTKEKKRFNCNWIKDIEEEEEGNFIGRYVDIELMKEAAKQYNEKNKEIYVNLVQDSVNVDNFSAILLNGKKELEQFYGSQLIETLYFRGKEKEN